MKKVDYRDFFSGMLARGNVKPRRHPHEEEHHLQCACVQWFRLQYPDFSGSLFAVPNGGRRDKVTGAKLKAEGVKAGVSDLVLLKQRHGCGALLVEMKTPSGRQSQSQRQWQRAVEADGYRYAVCRTIEDFITIVNEYLNE